MTHRELKKIAKEIAACEKTISTTQDEDEKSKAQLKIMRLTERLTDFNDFMVLDGLISDLLKNNT